MSEVKRYDAGCDYAGEEEMVERADGDFVRYEDYTALEQQLINILKSAGIEADTVQAGVMELITRMNQVVAKGKELAEEAAYVYGKYNDEMAPDMVCDGQTIQEFFDVANRTKTTEAYLNAVRADAVEDVAKRLYGQGYNFEVLTRFAAQLRDGNAGKDGSHD